MSITFSGASGQELNFDSLSAIRNLATKTWSAWIYITSATGGGGAFAGLANIYRLVPAVSGTDEEWHIVYVADGSIRLYYKWSTSQAVWGTAASTIALNTWYHIVVTYNNGSTSNDPSIYINGVSSSVNELISPTGSLIVGTNNTLSLGANPLDTNSVSITGSLDGCAMWNRILSMSEITSLYEHGRDGVLSWTEQTSTGLVFVPNLNRVTEKSYDTDLTAGTFGVPDLVSGGFGIIVGGTQYNSGAELKFTGLTTGYSKFTTPSGSSGLTTRSISLWFYPNTLTTGGYDLMYFGNNPLDGTKEIWKISIPATPNHKKISFTAYWNGGATAAKWTTNSDQIPTTGSWYHIVITYNGTSTANDPTIYVNGSSVAITENTSPGANIVSSAGDLHIGGWSGSPTGKIKWFRVFNVVLSAGEVTTLYGGGSGGTVSSGLVFSQGTINMFMDKSSCSFGTLCGLVGQANTVRQSRERKVRNPDDLKILGYAG